MTPANQTKGGQQRYDDVRIPFYAQSGAEQSHSRKEVDVLCWFCGFLIKRFVVVSFFFLPVALEARMLDGTDSESTRTGRLISQHHHSLSGTLFGNE